MADSHNSNADHFERADVVLEVADLRAGYGRVPVLHGVNLQIHEGEAVGIVGHNGMGKTTLLKVIMGLMPSTGGRIVLDGSEATGSPAHQRSQMGIGYVPQGRGILHGLTALENLRMAWRADIGVTEEQSVERVVRNSATTGRITVSGNTGGDTVAVLPVGSSTEGIHYRKIQIWPLPNTSFPINVQYYKQPFELGAQNADPNFADDAWAFQAFQTKAYCEEEVITHTKPSTLMVLIITTLFIKNYQYTKLSIIISL